MVGRADPDAEIAKYADVLAAMGNESRLRIVQLLLGAHPDGLFAGELGEQLGIAPSTLSHHLDKLRAESVLTVERQGTFLRYRVDADALSGLLRFLWSQCCTGNPIVDPATLTPTASTRTGRLTAGKGKRT
ncbi:MAG: ArsR/SmtB family transcription factor [Acidimicrobiales bacterium]